jgi:hypothetical protein
MRCGPGLIVVKAYFGHSTFRHIRFWRIEGAETLDNRTRGVPKSEIPFLGKGRGRVGGRGEVEGPVDRMLRFR